MKRVGSVGSGPPLSEDPSGSSGPVRFHRLHLKSQDGREAPSEPTHWDKSCDSLRMHCVCNAIVRQAVNSDNALPCVPCGGRRTGVLSELDGHGSDAVRSVIASGCSLSASATRRAAHLRITTRGILFSFISCSRAGSRVSMISSQVRTCSAWAAAASSIWRSCVAVGANGELSMAL